MVALRTILPSAVTILMRSVSSGCASAAAGASSMGFPPDSGCEQRGCWIQGSTASCCSSIGNEKFFLFETQFAIVGIFLVSDIALLSRNGDCPGAGLPQKW